MKLKRLGNSSTFVPAIGQGCMGLGGNLKQGASSDRRSIDALRLGIELGITLIDTAEGYSEGQSEALVGRAVRGVRDRVFIATKVSPENLSYDRLIKACERSLCRLGTDYIDLYQVHWPNPTIPIEETISAMQTLAREGKIRFVGLSNFSCDSSDKVRSIKSTFTVDFMQAEYNLFDRSIEKDILPYCERLQMLLLAYSPLDQGHLTYDGHRGKILDMLATKYGKARTQIILNWLIKHTSVVAIPKASTAEHIRMNADACDFELSDEDSRLIDSSFPTEVVEVPVDQIRVVLDGQGHREAYQTIENALANSLGFCPSPVELADSIKKDGERIKPVRVRKSADTSGRYIYDLVEGRIRYWAWVIAHGGSEPIPVLHR